jgi:membrane protease YdiL (CAAX protease family)
MLDTVLPRDRWAFARSLLPSQGAHWLLLMGSFFLFISHEARWLPYGPVQHEYDLALFGFSWFLTLPLMVAGAVGWYIALLPPSRPAKRLVVWVILPAATTVLLIAIASTLSFLIPQDPPVSIVEATLDISVRLSQFFHVFTGLGIGIRLALFGLVLTCVFIALLEAGRASLPVNVGVPCDGDAFSAKPDELAQEHRRLMRFVWFMTSLSVLPWLVARLFRFFLMLQFEGWAVSHPHVLPWIEEITLLTFLFLLVFFAIGKDCRCEIRGYFRWPSVRDLFLSVLFPSVVTIIWPLIQFVHSRILWAGDLLNSFVAPHLANYFRTPDAFALHFIPSALVEEIAWRGYLQPRFVRQYGLLRGIIFVGVVWGVFHFYFDFTGAYSWTIIRTNALDRIIGTVALSFPIAWVTIRSKSILPATLFHAAYNAGLHITRNPLPGIQWLHDASYIILGYILFRYFPTTTDDPAPRMPQSPLEQSPEAASPRL